MRNTYPLNFGWKYTPDFSEEMLASSYDDSAFVTVDIPHTNKELPYNYFDEKSYQFISCYRKSFDADPKEGKRYFLHFEGASSYARVVLNDTPLGEHKGGYTPFVFEVTRFLKKKGNLLSVMLDSRERDDIPPFGDVIDYLVYGGIYREVWLEEVPECYIKDIFVRTPDIAGEKKKIEIDVTFERSTEGNVLVQLLDGDEVISEQRSQFSARILRLKWGVAGAELWTLGNPKLYTLRVTCGDDEKCVRFGFRTAEFRRDGFYLNNRRIKLRGLNRHQCYPYVGYAMPASAQRADADFLKKELGVNLVRTSHYPDSVHFLDRCDEIGLLVFTEIPGWHYIGGGEWRDNTLKNVRTMITRDRNHPSVILWGVRINESADCDELYTLTNELAHKLDDTRQTGGVRVIPRSHLIEDVYTYNDFAHAGGKMKLLPPTLVTGFTAPYLVTEHNGHMFPTKSFDREALRTEHALRHARVLDRAYANGRISGAIGWCMSDYNTHKDFGSGDRICYHGVADMWRIPKLAGAVYSSQQDEIPVLEVSSSMDVGEHPGAQMGKTYVFTNCDYVKLYKNNVYTSTAYPARNLFPALPHPPVVAADFIGNALVEKEGLDEKTAALLRDALVAGAQDGVNMGVLNMAKLAASYVMGHMKFAQIYDIVTRYIANWGSTQITYTFEGYKDGKLVKTVTKTASNEVHLYAKADSSVLREGDTYDVTRIALVALDQNNNRLPFADCAVRVSVKGASIIGPSEFPLTGGVRAFWIRTNGTRGKITVNIDAGEFGKQKLELSAE